MELKTWLQKSFECFPDKTINFWTIDTPLEYNDDEQVFDKTKLNESSLDIRIRNCQKFLLYYVPSSDEEGYSHDYYGFWGAGIGYLIRVHRHPMYIPETLPNSLKEPYAVDVFFSEKLPNYEYHHIHKIKKRYPELLNFCGDCKCYNDFITTGHCTPYAGVERWVWK